MLILYAVAATLLNVVWVLLNVLGLPGNWLIVLTCLGAWWLTRDDAGVSPLMHGWVLAWLSGLALVGELMEFWMGAAGASKAGASWRGSIGAILGAIIGGIFGTVLIPIPIIGSILGACLGAFAGALALEFLGGRNVKDSMTVGHGAAVGRFWGTVAKLSIGGVMWVAATAALFWP